MLASFKSGLCLFGYTQLLATQMLKRVMDIVVLTCVRRPAFCCQHDH